MLASTTNDNEIVSTRVAPCILNWIELNTVFKKADIQGEPPDGYNFIIIVRWQHCLIRFKYVVWLRISLRYVFVTVYYWSKHIVTCQAGRVSILQWKTSLNQKVNWEQLKMVYMDSLACHNIHDMCLQKFSYLSNLSAWSIQKKIATRHEWIRQTCKFDRLAGAINCHMPLIISMHKSEIIISYKKSALLTIEEHVFIFESLQRWTQHEQITMNYN